MPDTRLKYLAYGSNLHPARLHARVDSARLLGTTILSGWRLAFHKRGADGSAKCNIVCTDVVTDTVHAAVFSISPHDRPVLDSIEGLGQGYLEQVFHLPDYGRVFAYRADSDFIEETLQPYDWYHQLVWHGARYHGFPETYVRLIASFTAIGDPDPQRRRHNLELVSGLSGSIADRQGKNVSNPL